ncbi:MAG TPA: DUF488 family protein [Alphaproteobacteria bacterium]|jgi:uncharacterized protein YeaO (DUF488 family)
MARIRLKRIYDPPAREDGHRVLVERLWPRGLSKDRAALDAWLKDVAPSDGLRRWYGHVPDRWPEFRQRYRVELAGRRDLVDRLLAQAAKGPVTLLFAARDGERNSAVVLKSVLERRMRTG